MTQLKQEKLWGNREAARRGMGHATNQITNHMHPRSISKDHNPRIEPSGFGSSYHSLSISYFLEPDIWAVSVKRHTGRARQGQVAFAKLPP